MIRKWKCNANKTEGEKVSTMTIIHCSLQWQTNHWDKIFKFYQYGKKKIAI